MSSALPGRAMVAVWRGMTRYRTPSLDTCVLFRDGACAEAERACPPDPPSKSDGKPDDGLTTGVYVWEGTLTPKLDGVRWEGTWRRITAKLLLERYIDIPDGVQQLTDGDVLRALHCHGWIQ